MLISSLIVGL